MLKNKKNKNVIHKREISIHSSNDGYIFETAPHLLHSNTIL